MDGWCCLGNHPLQDAGVFPASGDQVTVVVEEGNVGHVTAVATVLVARSLKEWGGSEVYQSDVKRQPFKFILQVGGSRPPG